MSDRPQFDKRDAEIRLAAIAARDRVRGPRVGDYVRMGDGTLRRFTYHWGDSIQTTVGEAHPCSGDASFYLGSDGGMSFSGSLNRGIPVAQIESTEKVLEGSAWFFHHGQPAAHCGVSCSIPCRVFLCAEVTA